MQVHSCNIKHRQFDMGVETVNLQCVAVILFVMEELMLSFAYNK